MYCLARESTALFIMQVFESFSNWQHNSLGCHFGHLFSMLIGNSEDTLSLKPIVLDVDEDFELQLLVKIRRKALENLFHYA